MTRDETVKAAFLQALPDAMQRPGVTVRQPVMLDDGYYEVEVRFVPVLRDTL